MKTGLIENWVGKISDIGPMYPFVGSEKLLVLVCVGLWIVWHIIQIVGEGKELKSNLPSAESVANIEKNL